MLKELRFKIDSKEVTLTKRQAEMLYRELHELFGEPAPIQPFQPYIPWCTTSRSISGSDVTPNRIEQWTDSNYSN